MKKKKLHKKEWEEKMLFWVLTALCAKREIQNTKNLLKKQLNEHGTCNYYYLLTPRFHVFARLFSSLDFISPADMKMFVET